MARVRPGCTLGVVVVLVSGLAGCVQNNVVPARLSPAEEMALGTRALDLLLRAAERDDGLVTSNAIEALAEVAPQAGREAYLAATESATPVVRYAGFVALGDTQTCTQPARFATGVNDANALVRQAAAYAAYRCGRDGYARVLTRDLTDSHDENVRANAALLIGKLDEPRARKWLNVAAQVPANERSNHVMLCISWALARLGSESATRDLIRLSQGDAATRTDALLLLARLRSPLAADALRYHLYSKFTDYWVTRLIAARGLGALGYDDGFALAVYMLNYADPHGGSQATNDTYAVRSAAIHALAQIGDARALAPLATIASDESNPRLQVAAAYAILKIRQNVP